MTNICVITGGGSGMGFEAARILGRDNKIILVGRTVEKLDNAINKLKSEGIDAEAYPADTSDRASIKKLVDYASSKGKIKSVIHAAGISPHMASGEKIFDINAVGTININEEFGEVMEEKSCILNVSSMSAYMLPEDRIPKQIYKMGLSNTEMFKGAMAQVLGSVPEDMKPGTAYTISKNFVVWYSVEMALKLGRKGVRVVSISPGTFSTPMGEVEGDQAASFALNGALGRVGEPKEIAKMMAFIVSDEASYLTGTDILYDGGSIAAFKAGMEEKANAKDNH